MKNIPKHVGTGSLSSKGKLTLAPIKTSIGFLWFLIIPFNDLDGGIYTGTWNGKTDQQFPITITVNQANQITRVKFQQEISFNIPVQPFFVRCTYMIDETDLTATIDENGSFDVPVMAIVGTGQTISGNFRGTFYLNCNSTLDGIWDVATASINCQNSSFVGASRDISFVAFRQGGEPRPCVTTSPEGLFDSDPTTIVLDVNFPSIDSIQSAQGWYNGNDVTPLILESITSVQETTARAVFPQIALPPATAGAFEFRLSTDRGRAIRTFSVHTTGAPQTCYEFGGTANNFTSKERLVGQTYSVFEPQVLTEIQANVFSGQSANLWFFVMEGDINSLAFIPKLARMVSIPANTRGFHSSGPIGVFLQPNTEYGIGVAWGNVDMTYHFSPQSLPAGWPLGQIEAGFVRSNVNLPGYAPLVPQQNITGPFYIKLCFSSGS